jgi:hypothetical protein
MAAAKQRSLGGAGKSFKRILFWTRMPSSLRATAAGGGSAVDAGREVLLEVERLLAERQSFTVETTLSGNTYIRTIARAKDLGYQVVLIYIGDV